MIGMSLALMAVAHTRWDRQHFIRRQNFLQHLFVIAQASLTSYSDLYIYELIQEARRNSHQRCHKVSGMRLAAERLHRLYENTILVKT